MNDRFPHQAVVIPKFQEPAWRQAQTRRRRDDRRRKLIRGALLFLLMIGAIRLLVVLGVI